jgi:hypothetical protein
MTATETTRAAQNEERETVVTTFPDSYAKDKTQDRFTLTALAVRLDGSEAVETKADCVFIKMAEFGDKPSPKVISVSGCEVDYDDGVMTFDDAEAILIANDIGCLLYTSASHTDEKPRWRGLFPFTQGITGTTEHMRWERKRMVARVDALLGNILAKESYTLSQSFYFRVVKEKKDADLFDLVET